MREMGARNVLIKGGHFNSGQLTDSGRSRTSLRRAVDYLFAGDDFLKIEGEYHETTATHGTGCTLSAAIAANLALGRSLHDAVAVSKQFVNEAIRTAPNIGRGHSPINIKPI